MRPAAREPEPVGKEATGIAAPSVAAEFVHGDLVHDARAGAGVTEPTPPLVKQGLVEICCAAAREVGSEAAEDPLLLAIGATQRTAARQVRGRRGVPAIQRCAVTH